MTIGSGQSHGRGFEFNTHASGEIFNDNPQAAYWIGRVAIEGESQNAEYYDALARFRGNVYVREMGFLSPDTIDSEGRELDSDDARSIQFGVIENLASTIPPSARIVGSGRLIVKNPGSDLLPIEKQFPELFESNPIEEGCAEVSRFISRHEDQFTQHAIALSVIRAMSHYSVNNEIKTNYCLVERPLLGLLAKIGIPLEQIGDPKEVTEPGGVRTLHPISIDSKIILDSVKKDVHDQMFLKQFFENEINNAGEGYYPATLIGGKL